MKRASALSACHSRTITIMRVFCMPVTIKSCRAHCKTGLSYQTAGILSTGNCYNRSGEDQSLNEFSLLWLQHPLGNQDKGSGDSGQKFDPEFSKSITFEPGFDRTFTVGA
jgi:hypothetical protein